MTTQEPTPEALDEWRMSEARKAWPRKSDGSPENNGNYAKAEVLDEYRRLVRENVLPPAEPIGNDLPKWAQDEAERLAKAEPAPKWGVHDSPRSHYALARLIAKQGKPVAEPVAEPDQDTLDTRDILENHGRDVCAGTGSIVGAKQALVRIKARVRREAIEEHNNAARNFSKPFQVQAQRQSKDPLEGYGGHYGY